jgi:hypothetical protein
MKGSSLRVGEGKDSVPCFFQDTVFGGVEGAESVFEACAVYNKRIVGL